MAENAAVTVDTGARLHLGFLDLNGGLGRRFGSMGLAIDGFRTRVTVTPAEGVTAYGPAAERAARCAHRALEGLGLKTGVDLTVHEAIPEHLGLGSGTQMSLAVGAAIARLYQLDTATAELAGIAERGARSGIGIGSFRQGGFMLDGGRGGEAGTPPLLSRMVFPEAWRVILVLDGRGEGLHGASETEAFRHLPPFPAEQAAHLCRLALMQILPALAEQRIDPFARGVAEVQRAVGDHFASAQGGRFTSRRVGEVLKWAEQEGFPGVGQSSWGPTGFVLAESQAAADALLLAARRRFGDLSGVRFRIVSGRNHGGHVSSPTPLGTLKSVT